MNEAPTVAEIDAAMAELESLRDQWIEIGCRLARREIKVEPGNRHLSDALSDIRVRDSLFWHMVDDSVKNPAVLAGWLEMFQNAAKREADAFTAADAPALACASIADWFSGDDEAMKKKIRMAQVLDPSYSILALLDSAARYGMSPTSWAQMIQGLTYEECRHGDSTNSTNNNTQDEEN
jgi:hypothetical protein